VKKRDDTILAELRRIAAENGGFLAPVQIVQAARPKDSPLHGKFTWDNRKAAEEYRLWEARELVKVYWYVAEGSRERVPVFISLSSDRPVKAGYRSSADVLANPDQRGEWLQMALADLQSWKRSYAALTELKPVFAAIARVIAKYAKEEEAA